MPSSKNLPDCSSTSSRLLPSQKNWIERLTSDWLRPTASHASSNLPMTLLTAWSSPPEMFHTSAWRAVRRSVFSPDAPIQIGGGGVFGGVGVGGARGGVCGRAADGVPRRGGG